MRDNRRSYLEIKITFIHVVVFLAAVILIGIFLFYLGFQAGKSSLSAPESTLAETSEQVRVDDTSIKPSKSAIQDEMNLHEGEPVAQPGKSNTQPPKARKVKARSVQRDTYFAVQVAAFENHAEAKSYSDLFIRNNHPTEIHSVVVGGKTMYRVLVGRYQTRTDAGDALGNLEKLAGRKGFFIRRMP